MVKHIILWNLKSDLSDSEKEKIRKNAKRELENLIGKIPGLLEMKIEIAPLGKSNVDMMLNSSFTDEEALKNYAVHPEHVKVADTFVRPFTESRKCMDYKVEKNGDEWTMSVNSAKWDYDISKAFQTLGTLEFKKPENLKDVKNGDTIYLYDAAKKTYTWECKVVKKSVKPEIDDSVFIGEKTPLQDGYCMQLKAVREMNQ